MSNRAAIQLAIVEQVNDAVAHGVELDVTDVALKLSTRFPQSGYTIDDICRMIDEATLHASLSAAAASRLRQKPPPAAPGT